MTTKPLFANRALTFLTVTLLIAVGASVQAEEKQTLTCVYEDEVYQAGETIEIDGEMMTCDGRTGTWVPVPEY